MREDTQEVYMVDAPLTAAKLAKSAKFNLEEEDGNIYSDTEMDMPGYEPPRSFEDEPIPTSAAPVDEEQLEKRQESQGKSASNSQDSS